MSLFPRDWPRLEHMSINLSPLHFVNPTSFGIACSLAYHLGAQTVHTMGEPSNDPKIENDIKILKRVLYCSKKQWLESTRDLSRFFDIQHDYIRISDDSIIVISKQGSRPATTQTIRNQISLRDGEMCVYCGDTEGPFEIDHLWPVVKGGTSEASNLVCSCKSCNRSKSSMSLREWMDKEAGRSHD